MQFEENTKTLQEFVNNDTLAEILGVSRRTIERHSANIAGRIKVGGAVRYNIAAIRREILAGRDPLKANAPKKGARA